MTRRTNESPRWKQAYKRFTFHGLLSFNFDHKHNDSTLNTTHSTCNKSSPDTAALDPFKSTTQHFVNYHNNPYNKRTLVPSQLRENETNSHCKPVIIISQTKFNIFHLPPDYSCHFITHTLQYVLKYVYQHNNGGSFLTLDRLYTLFQIQARIITMQLLQFLFAVVLASCVWVSALPQAFYKFPRSCPANLNDAHKCGMVLDVKPYAGIVTYMFWTPDGCPQGCSGNFSFPSPDTFKPPCFDEKGAMPLKVNGSGGMPRTVSWPEGGFVYSLNKVDPGDGGLAGHLDHYEMKFDCTTLQAKHG